MTQEDFNKLQRGDLIKHKTSTTAYMVAGNYGNRVTAVATADICNPDEWSVVYKVEPKRAKTPKEVMIECLTGISVEQWEATNEILKQLK